MLIDDTRNYSIYSFALNGTKLLFMYLSLHHTIDRYHHTCHSDD